ncbi:hypothetical protein [Paludibacter sp.]|uniref:hypothetical protein n=1 Tax=Paludibacter sp. TaxID=1898105 RepID=UPI001353427E|nr:hypothetical protein [Paludibacter sp.]MTK53425.1 hypothetical protein [Paludibacter sp.]
MYKIHRFSMLKFCAVVAFTVVCFSSNAQNNTNHFSIAADVVSSYVWRGVAQEGSRGGSPNIQPTVSYTNGAFNLGAWGSYAFSGNVKEVDLYATLSLPDALSVTVTDYNWNNGNDGSVGYFNYKNGKTGHVFEGTLAYGGTKSFPLSITWNTMLYGADKKTNGNQAFSTYVEIGLPITSNVKAFLGASLFDSPNYYNNGFSVINLGLKVSKEIKFSDSFSLPVYGIVGANPQSEKAFFIAGITL